MTWIQRDQRKLFSKDVRYMQLHKHSTRVHVVFGSILD